MLVNFKLGTSTDYTSNTGSYSNYIYACTDTRDVYFYGVLQQGISDELWQKLGNPENLINQTINSLKGQQNGIASLDENGKIPVSQLNGQLARVQGVDAVTTSSTLPSDVANEYMVYTTDNKKFNEYSTEKTSWTTIDPQGDTIYNFRNSDATGSPSRTNILYRWDGENLVEISASIALGETTGTAYEGSKGKENRDALNSLPEKLLYLTNNQGTVSEHNLQFSFDTYTKNLGNNQYTKDGAALTLNVPVFDEGSAAQQGLITKADYDYLKSLGIVILSGTELQEIRNSNGETPLSEDLYNKLNADGVKLVISADNTVAKATSIFTVVNSDGSILLSEQGGLDGEEDILLSTNEFEINSDKIATHKGANAIIEKSGDGSKALFDDGTYKTVSVPENTITSIKIGENEDAIPPVGGLVTLPAATTEQDGILSKADKTSLENLKGLGIVYINDTEYQEITNNLGSTAISENLYNKFTDPNAKVVIAKDPAKGYKLFTLSTGEESSIILKGTDTNTFEQYNTNHNITYFYESYSIDTERIPSGITTSISFQTTGEGTKYLNDQGQYVVIDVPTEATEIKLSDAYAPSELENAALEPAAGDTVEIATGKLHKAILDNEEVVSNALNAIKEAVGLTDAVAVPSDKTDTNYMQNSDSIWEALKALDTKIKELETALTLQTVV